MPYPGSVLGLITMGCTRLDADSMFFNIIHVSLLINNT